MHTIKAEIVRTENCARQIYDQHCHAHYEIIFVLDGSIRLNVEGEQLRLRENMGIVLEPLKYHVVTGDNTRYHRLILSFEPESVPEAVYERFLDSVRTNAVFSGERASRLLRRFSATAEKGDPVYGPLLEAILTEAVYDLAFNNTPAPESKESKPTEKLKQITAFIDQNLHSQISLDDIAARMYMSQSALCHLFRQEMQISLKQYILQKKMMYAKSLLEKGTAPGTAAALCGYKNYASFYKIFLKVTGQAPGQVVQEE